MARERIGPSYNELVAYLKRGLTQAQMAEEHVKRYGEGRRVTRTAIASLIRREGLSDTAKVYDRTIPWTVHDKPGYRHSNTATAQRLRAWGRRLNGDGPQNDEEPGRLDAFIRNIEELDAVVVYAPETPEGFYLVKRHSMPDDWIDPELPIVPRPLTERVLMDLALGRVAALDNNGVAEDRKSRHAH